MPQKSFSIYRGLKQNGSTLPLHTHRDGQLTFAASGMVQVYAGEGRWLVPPQLAVWIPEGVSHRVEVLTDAELWMVHWKPSAARAWAPQASLGQAFALRVTPLLHALLVTLFAADTGPEKATLAAKLMLHELTNIEHAPTFLPLPTGVAGRRVADIALGDHQQRLSVGELASRAATSIRTLSRIFPAETGLTFKAWRQRARIVHSMDLLGRGDTIARVAAKCGFASTAAFSFAFRQVTAMTPTTFIERPKAATQPKAQN